jgi:hypothetical protein
MVAWSSPSLSQAIRRCLSKRPISCHVWPIGRRTQRTRCQTPFFPVDGKARIALPLAFTPEGTEKVMST